ncbi:MAG TPA: carboxypeptidase-like regulatory domain-containing protein, partial [Blastocatellia bacterium]|nr:carboxypeptidase-like regulatory domain-containing protein [Blastocatellia bacterium]
MKRGKVSFQCLSAVLAFVMAPAPILAQNRKPVEARLRVTVVDQTGAAIPNARVTINKQRQTLVTGKLGEVNFGDLAPGKYQLRVAAEGFTSIAAKDVSLRAGANNLEVKLDVAD